MYRPSLENNKKILAIAPMMDWTDRHCRFFHRQFSSTVLSYTEMVVADAILHGDLDSLLGFDEIEKPLAVQLGGSDPNKLAAAAHICVERGFQEINLNVGCPSNRVQSGSFGACLMRHPELVARCVDAMKNIVADKIAITVKCRIGVDEQDPKQALPDLAKNVWAAGCDGLWVHARKAWLEGLSPKKNRDVPPLDYQLVIELKRNHPDHFIGLNGGFKNIEQCSVMLNQIDGIMIGRAAYQNPDILRGIDALMASPSNLQSDYWSKTDEIIATMCDYSDRHIASGGRLHQITRHMTGLFYGLHGARQWRRDLSNIATYKGQNSLPLLEAYKAVKMANKFELPNRIDAA